MAIIAKKIEDKKEKIIVDISSSIIEEMNEYMNWADISDINYFLEESLTFIFNSDRDRKKHKKVICGVGVRELVCRDGPLHF